MGIRIVGYGKDKKYTHVYGLVYLYDEWLPVDAIQRDVPIGWEHDNITCQKDYEV